jgi:Fic family protein
MKTNLITSEYLHYYKSKQPISILKLFNKIKETSLNAESFGYNIAKSSVYSSMIEGNPIDFDSYLRYTNSGFNNISKSFKEIQDLINAYDFASKNPLNKKNILTAHKILSKNLLEEEKYSGKIRDKDVFIFGGGIKIYEGAKKEIVVQEMETLYKDLKILIARGMTMNELFYYAAMIHLVFVKIHPFADGNGRMARLLEKWFLSQQLGKKAWFIQSEKLYQNRLKSYYGKMSMGPKYESTNYDLSVPFLLLLPMSLTA